MERWRPEDARGELLADRIAWHSPGAAEPLLIDLPSFFARALDGSP